MWYDPYTIVILPPTCMCAVPQTPAIPEDLPLKRNGAYATVSGVSLKKNEAYSVVVPLERSETYENVASALNTQTSPEYEIIQ